ncbi:hypothetical protein SAMN06265365_106167 [Tistlia consotensis]|uniref:DUF6815 domain-containing protein n=1 Tax=Tistlia consotensis USBA 355 TaxID=560819 RepID=A0A1Y6BDP0_9PROT|nr:Cj0069 family protein [Tistlia consotensis]SMF04698.1 hypothetical protein SAMN05428998_103218 [Tistlia consotensis USBA 355]SNR54692.1 hypothetical protein SAMN06265365_106167 [Tistlia consotensis]
MSGAGGRVALLWRGDRAARAAATPENSRLHRIFAALAACGLRAEPAVYAEEFAEEVRSQLLGCDVVLVWADPLSDGRTRAALDPLLREVAARGVRVSAHPDVIPLLGTKEVLHRTRQLGWGTGTRLYRTVEELRAGFPEALQTDRPRVLKRNRGNGGQGVWKVERLAAGRSAAQRVRVLEARRRSLPEELDLPVFLERCAAYLADDGPIVDQPFQARLPEGMIRCYLGADRVVGFGHQLIKALLPPPPEGPDSPQAQPGPRIMHPASAPPFARLRSLVEAEWLPQAMALLGLDRRSLPVIWDADFLYGPRSEAGEDSYVLCEINVSSVFPIPDDAPTEIARLTAELLQA